MSANAGSGIENASDARLNDLVIVSAYGRGDGLAESLAKAGWTVTLIDVSESLGPWDPEDAEGPFGLLLTSDLDAARVERDWSGANARVGGLRIWLRDGSLELRGEVSEFQLESRGVPAAVREYLGASARAARESGRERRALAKDEFREVWLAHLAHQLMSPVIEENHRALADGIASALLAPLIVRHTSRASREASLAACQKAGVRVRANAEIRDVRVVGRTVDAVEVADNRAGVERARTFVWLLSSAETAMGAESVAACLYPNGPVSADWYWARYQLKMAGEAGLDDQIPNHVVWLGEPFLPWTHENLMILRRHLAPSATVGGSGRYDLWLKLPTRVRFDHEYLTERGRKMIELLRARVPVLEPQIETLPIETRFLEKEIGPAKAPVFTREAIERLRELQTTNFFFGGIESCESLEAGGALRRQAEIVVKLEKLRAQWLAAARKQAARNPTSMEQP